MDEQLPWFRELPADERAWVSLVAQTGISAFVDWFAHTSPRPSVTIDVFDTAPRDLARAISLEQTVAMVRCTIELIEEHVPRIAGPEAADEVLAAILTYSREVAFAAAEVYARAAEARGAWDARLEALVLDGLLKGEPGSSLSARVAALGWSADAGVLVLVGSPPTEPVEDSLRHAAHHHRIDVLSGMHDRALVVIAGSASANRTSEGSPSSDGSSSRPVDHTRVIRILEPHFGPGPLVYSGPAFGLAETSTHAIGARAAWQVAHAWPNSPRPVPAHELLPERAMAGEPGAREALVAETYLRLREADPALIITAAMFLEQTGSLEGTARALFVHVNTVRHRLRRVEQLTTRSPTDPRDALALRLGLLWGRLLESPSL